MTTQQSVSTRRPASADRASARAGALALGAAAVSVLTGVTQVLHPQDLDPAIDPRTRVMLTGVALMLWALSAVYLHLARYARGRWASRTAAAGMVLLSLGMLSSAVNGTDLAIFPAVASVANALWLVGSVGLAVSLWRAGRVPRPVAVLLVLVMPATIVGSQLGGGVLAGAYLAVLGWLLLRGQLAAPASRGDSPAGTAIA